jgi:hypothetical protein
MKPRYRKLAGQAQPSVRGLIPTIDYKPGAPGVTIATSNSHPLANRPNVGRQRFPLVKKR